ncbi:MAG: hypothetical protein KF777_20930 [Planctomycetaceae bacterium]|nr:hypothetical protein [Planctomycetaceae bacterium]
MSIGHIPPTSTGTTATPSAEIRSSAGRPVWLRQRDTGSSPPPLPEIRIAPQDHPAGSADKGIGLFAAIVSLDFLRGAATSLVLHVAVLGSLALVVYKVAPPEFFSIVALPPTANEQLGFTDSLDSKLDTGQDSASSYVTPVDILAADSVRAADELLKASVGEGGEESGVGEMDGDIQPSVAVPEHAVTKGSFSAWTVPEDPEPGMPYRIVIQVRLPDKIEVYRPADLRGMVIGTDGYRQTIYIRNREPVPVVDNTVQFELRVPGASKLVRDTIRVESRILREKQVLEIVF